jgi:DNA-binding NarL/FixJ family response regulator
MANIKTNASAISVMVVDDHAILRHGIVTLIEDESDLTVCGEASNAAEAITTAERENPDVVIVDLALGYDDGLELIQELRHRWIGMRTVVVTARPGVGFARKSMEAGADAFVTKDEALDHLVDAIRSVAAGETFLSPRPAEILGKN